jgi:hypothetical protein
MTSDLNDIEARIKAIEKCVLSLVGKGTRDSLETLQFEQSSLIRIYISLYYNLDETELREEKRQLREEKLILLRRQEQQQGAPAAGKFLFPPPFRYLFMFLIALCIYIMYSLAWYSIETLAVCN